jgi:glycosyltransferase involved in cell wall biosynthesis
MQRKIGFVVNACWNVFNFRKGLVMHFLRQGHRVLVFAPEDGYADKVRAWGVEVVPVNIQSSGTNPLRDIAYYRQLIRAFKKTMPDILLGFTIKPNIYGSLAAFILGIPIISNVSGLGTVFLWKGWVNRVARTLYRRAFSRTDFIFFQNAEDRADFLKQIPVNESKTGLLPGSGIDLAHFQSPPPTFSGPTTFLMISRLIVEKGVEEYAQAARLVKQAHPDCQFILIGTLDPGHARTVAPVLVDSWVKDGILAYLQPVDDIRPVINMADVVVLPSYREGTPRTLLEAAAMARPIIATDVPGCREVVDDGKNGFLCAARDTESLASRMKLFLAMTKEEKRTMSTASRILVEERFDESVVIGEYERRIDSLLTSR